MRDITFQQLDVQDYAVFRNDVKRIFSIAVIEEFGETQEEGNVIPDEDIDLSLYNPQCEAFFVYDNGNIVGGIAIKKKDMDNQCNWLDLFYVYPDKHGKGLGTNIWQAIERKYLETKVWRLITPYFEKRNIHFYVNKCGFKIVEFFNRAHRDPNRLMDGADFHNEYFVFEKRIR